MAFNPQHIEQDRLDRLSQFLGGEDHTWARTTDIGGPEDTADGLFVFGRSDVLVARKMSELLLGAELREDATIFGDEVPIARWAMITGGVGKDSGGLARLQISEAKGLAAAAVLNYGIEPEWLILEEKATNGGENARFGIAAIQAAEQDPGNDLVATHDSLTVVAHYTSALRLLYTVMHEADKSLGTDTPFMVDEWNLAATDFRPEFTTDPNLQHMYEIAAETVRCIEGPAKDFMRPVNFPGDMALDVEYAVQIHPELKALAEGSSTAR